MDCRNFRRNLEDYLDGGLDFAGRLGMERHAEQCFACGKELADAHGLRLLSASITRVHAPDDFEARVRREIIRRKSQGILTQVRNRVAFGFEWRRFAFTAVVCAMLAVGIYYVRQIQITPEKSTTAAGEAGVVESPENYKPDNYKIEALDLLLVSPDSYHTPEQLPMKIHVRYGPPSEEYFIRNVSH